MNSKLWALVHTLKHKVIRAHRLEVTTNGLEEASCPRVKYNDESGIGAPCVGVRVGVHVLFFLSAL